MSNTTAHITNPYRDTPAEGFPQVWTVTVTAHAHFDSADEAEAFHDRFKPMEDTLIDATQMLPLPMVSRKAHIPAPKPGQKSSRKFNPKYPQEIYLASARARAIGGKTWWPSPVDHIHARTKISEALAAEGKVPTRQNLLELCGTTMANLRKIANMKAPRSALAQIAHVSALMDDASARGRNLAAIIVVWCDELPRT